MSEEIVPEYVKKRVLILGVGNVLFGDDGFGPAAADYILRNCAVPNDVYVMDVGTGAGDVLFTVGLSPQKPEKIVILDAVDMKRKPGEIFELSIDGLPTNKMTDFSLHLFPAANLLKELKEQMGVDVIILACQVKTVPESVNPGLSETVRRVLPVAAQKALRLTARTEG